MPDSNPVLTGLLRGYQLANQIRMQRQQAEQQEAQQAEIQRRRQIEEENRAEQKRVTSRREQIENARNLIELQKAGGFKLTSEQLTQLAGGGDFSVPLGDGIATTASSANRIQMPDGTYLLPQPGDLREASLQREMDERDRKAEAEALPIPPVVAAALGLPEGATAPASLIDNYMTGFNSVTRADQPRTKTAIDQDGSLVEIDLNTGKLTRHPFVSPRPRSESPSDTRLNAKASVENTTRLSTNNAIAAATDENGNVDWAKARQIVTAEARKNKDIDLAEALRAIRALEPRESSSTSSADDAFLDSLGIGPEGEGEGMGLGDIMGGKASEESLRKSLGLSPKKK